MKINQFLALLRTILEIIIVYYFFVVMKKSKNLCWLYYFFLILSVLIFSVWPAGIAFAFFAPSNASSNIFLLPFWVYVVFVLVSILSFILVEILVNLGLKETGNQGSAKFSFLNFGIGLLLVILLFQFGTGGIAEMKRRDEAYRNNIRIN
jgi:hypothetical protein